MKEHVKTKPVCSKRDELLFYRDKGRSARFSLSEGARGGREGSDENLNIKRRLDFLRKHLTH